VGQEARPGVARTGKLEPGEHKRKTPVRRTSDQAPRGDLGGTTRGKGEKKKIEAHCQLAINVRGPGGRTKKEEKGPLQIGSERFEERGGNCGIKGGLSGSKEILGDKEKRTLIRYGCGKRGKGGGKLPKRGGGPSRGRGLASKVIKDSWDTEDACPNKLTGRQGNFPEGGKKKRVRDTVQAPRLHSRAKKVGLRSQGGMEGGAPCPRGEKFQLRKTRCLHGVTQKGEGGEKRGGTLGRPAA